MKKILLLLATGIGWFSYSQTTVIMDAASDNTTVNTCLGGLFDSGGAGAVTPYTNNESYTVTICPDTPGDFITLYWVVFQLDPTDNIPGPGSDADNMTIYDGPNTSAGTLGTYTTNALDGLIVSASNLNPSGCLTIVFNSNSSGVGNFNASISCETPCDAPVVAGEIANADNMAGDSIAVCVGELVTFNDTGSAPGPGFSLVQWTWDFMDGTADSTSGLTTTHAFSAPGEYLVQLYVEDDNGCTNNNLLSLQVLVATPPDWDPFPGDTTICLGESVAFQAQPAQYEVEWTGFPGGVWDSDHCVPDDVGVLNTMPMTMTGFNSSEIIDQVSDIVSICVDIEHSFMGDFVLQIQCPTGQIMTLHQQGGGGTNLGVPSYSGASCDNMPLNIGTPWNYCFTPAATVTWIAAVPVAGTLPVGDYMPIDPFTDLFGCPLNGVWQLLFTDLWGGDDGYLPGFQINLDPPLYPAITQFTPQIGLGMDSSYWDLGDPYIIANSPDGEQITVQPTLAGAFPYTYTCINDFGCTYDSTITVTVNANPPAIAGLDTTVCNGTPITLGAPTAMCSTDAGNFTLCYGENAFQTWTYCPDTPGDGLTFMSISFNAGTTETWFDFVTIYDGSNTSAPVIAGPMDGNLAGLSWQATNPSGCITMLLTSDGSVSCVSGSTTAWDWDVSCGGGGPQLVYSWTPNDGSLDDVTIPNPSVINLTGTTTYTLTVYPVGHPDCIETDDVIVSVGGGLDPGTDSSATFCLEGPDEDLFNYLGGTPQTGGTWQDPAGNPVVMPIDPSVALQGAYEYRVDSAGCFAVAYIDVTIFTLQGATAVTNSDCQACNGSVTLSSVNGIAPLQYSNDGGMTFLAGDTFGSLCGGTAPGTNYSFVIKDAQGCLVTVDDDVIDINVPSLDAPVVVNSSCYTVCDGQITLTGLNLTNYQITNTAGTITQNTTGIFTALCADTYDIYVDNGFGCSVTATATITEPTPLQITSLTPDFTICAGEPANLNVTGTGGNGVYTYTWTTGATTLGTGTSLSFNPNASMQVCVTMSENCPSPTVQQCMNITIPPNAFPLMTSDVVSGCFPVEVNFTNLTAGSIATTLWEFSDGGSATISGTNPITHIFDNPGMYDVTMTVTTVDGCLFDTTFAQYIEVFDYPNAMYTYSPIPATIFETEITFNDFSSSDVVQWSWELGPMVIPGNSTEQNPTAVYPEGVPGDYPVMLHVWNTDGCEDSIAGVVSIVNEVILFAPNIFTPDGDEYNQYWRVYITGIDIYDFHLTMFNRWGEVVWESYNSEAGWNGKYGSQGLIQDGTYVWVIEAKDTYNDKKYEFRGHVTVLK
ncbi:MAG: PKD domain-containing protein [Bacteroidetes bacterium]|nr:PKD domain-containing protein [Bacteroidota bacterium]